MMERHCGVNREFRPEQAVPLLPAVIPPGQSAKDLRQTLDATKPITLKAGWNKLLVRFDLVWGENKLGLCLDAPPQVLWSLGFSPTPPK